MYSEFADILTERIEILRDLKKLTKETYEISVKETEEKLRDLFTEPSCRSGNANNAAYGDVVEEMLSGLEATRKKYILFKRNSMLEKDKVSVALILVPAIRKMNRPGTEELAVAIMEGWNRRYPESPFKLTEYDKIYNGFQKKLFGII